MTPVSYARLHSTIFVPGIGQLGPELSKEVDGIKRDMTMFFEENRLVVTIKNKSSKFVDIWIPEASVLLMVPIKDG